MLSPSLFSPHFMELNPLVPKAQPISSKHYPTTTIVGQPTSVPYTTFTDSKLRDLQDFLDIPQVQQDIVDGNRTPAVTTLKLLAWYRLQPLSPEQRLAMVDYLLPHIQHSGILGTGMREMVQNMNDVMMYPAIPLPPISDHHENWTVSQLQATVVQWDATGAPVQTLFQAVSGNKVLTKVSTKKRKSWWNCCCYTL